MDVHCSSWELHWTSNANLGLSGQARNSLAIHNPRHTSHSLKNDSLISFLLFLLLCFAASEASYYGPYKENYLRAGFAGPLLSRGSSAYIRVCISSSVNILGDFFLLHASPWNNMTVEKFTDTHLCTRSSSSAMLSRSYKCSTEVSVSTGVRTEWSWKITQYHSSAVILNTLPKPELQHCCSI